MLESSEERDRASVEKCICVLKTKRSDPKLSSCLPQYIVKVVEEYRLKRMEHIQIILEKVLDKVFEYQELIMVLGLVGNLYYQVARMIKIIYRALNDSTWLSEINTNAQKAQKYLELAL